MAASKPGDNCATAMKSVVVDVHAYDWEGDAPLKRLSARTIVYELHVRGFTRHPSSGIGEETRGTYAGLIEKIPYLQELGITAVELLPVFQFDPLDCPPGRVNYWGYAPMSFFAPHQAYSSSQDPLGAVDEFRDMVKALHRAGIEVILDVVYNHTADRTIWEKKGAMDIQTRAMNKVKDIMKNNTAPLITADVDQKLRAAFPGLVAGELLPIE